MHVASACACEGHSEHQRVKKAISLQLRVLPPPANAKFGEGLVDGSGVDADGAFNLHGYAWTSGKVKLTQTYREDTPRALLPC